MTGRTCLVCRFGSGDHLAALAGLAESASGGRSHHHHAVECGTCGAWWFDDVVTGGLGIPVAARRDTVLCGCPEDGAARYTQAIVLVPVPDQDCRCTAAEVERHRLMIRAGAGSR